jgi:hypothetical protein
MSDLTEIATGEGYYDGGVAVGRDGPTTWTLTEDDAGDTAYIQTTADVTFSNLDEGGTIPVSGGGATHAVLTDDDGTVANREVYAWGYFGGAKTSGTDQDFVVQNFRMTLTE